MSKRLSELIAALPDVVSITGDRIITSPVVEADSDLKPGGIFVARPGLSVDGHDFIPRAIEKGAAAIVGERDFNDLPIPYVQVKNAQEATGYLAAAYHDFPSHKLVVIGVTGTDGKTTTSTIIHSILQMATQGKAGLISTVAAELGNKSVDTGFHVTTPSAPMIQSLLAQMVANGLTHCVLEMTSHGLAQGRLNGVDVDVAVLTNLTHEHLDYHGSFENYRAAKGRMFELLGKSHLKPNQPKVSVINADDPNADFFADFPADEVIRYGIRSDNTDWRVVQINYEPDGTYFNVYNGWISNKRWRPTYGMFTPIVQNLFTNLIGEFNVMNIAAAVAATGFNAAAAEAATGKYTGRVPGVWIGAMKEGINAVKSIPGRMERIDEGQKFTAIVDFAHTPNALRNALQAGRAMLGDRKRLIVVFGSAGLRDREKRRLMAEIAAELADLTILTAEDPRTESLDDILDVMAQACIARGGVEGKTFIRILDRSEAIYRACQMAHPGDIVMACGKGHEQSMCFGTIEYPWDDRDAMRAALRGEPLKSLPTANNWSGV